MIPSVSLIALFCIFFYVGLITIGGGLVGITIMQEVIVDKYHLISPEMFYNMVAISESTPGPVGINMATYIGTELYGPIGGVITTIGQTMPSVIVILIIAKFFTRFADKPLVKAAFEGLRPATTGIIAVAAANVFVIALLHLPSAGISAFARADAWQNLINYKALFFYVVGLIILFKTKVHPVLVVALGAWFGILFC
jgi:chromate transporter